MPTDERMNPCRERQRGNQQHRDQTVTAATGGIAPTSRYDNDLLGSLRIHLPDR